MLERCGMSIRQPLWQRESGCYEPPAWIEKDRLYTGRILQSGGIIQAHRIIIAIMVCHTHQ